MNSTTIISPASRAARPGRRGTWLAVLTIVATVGVAACGSSAPSPTVAPSRLPGAEIRIGAVFPTTGSTAVLAGEELAGVQLAADFVNSDGGIDGRPIVLDVRDFQPGTDAALTMASLKAAGAVAVIGAYASELSVPASEAASDAGLVYWEAGAVADRLTGRGLPLVFRVGASGSNLGTNSATFAATELASRLDKTVAQTRVAIVAASDDYPRSVAASATATATSAGLDVVANLAYEASAPNWAPVMAALADARPDILILASHIPDGVAFRQAMLAAHLQVGALIGSTMAECDPDFAGALGPDAIGIFASDRPTGGFQPGALTADARRVYDRLATAWGARQAGGADGSPAPTRAGYGYGGGSGYGGDSGYGASPEPGTTASAYTISGPIEEGSSAAGPSEEALSGFSAAWALFHDVLPTTNGDLRSDAIAAAARSLDLPVGALPNGAGVRFSADPETLGQNERATAVIWQWQAERSYTFVWPATYQTGEIASVPLRP